MAGDPSHQIFFSSVSTVESKLGFYFAFFVVVSLLPVADAWDSAEELGLKVDVPSLRHLPYAPLRAYIYFGSPKKIPSEASLQGLPKSHLFGNKLRSLCGESCRKSFGKLVSSSAAKQGGKS